MTETTAEQLILSELQNLQSELTKHLRVIQGLLQEVEAGNILLSQEQKESMGCDYSKLQQTLNQIKTATKHLYTITAHKMIIRNKPESHEIQ